MKEHEIENIAIGKYTLAEAFDRVFTEGDIPWENDSRVTEYSIQLEKVPWLLRHIFRGSTMRVTVCQTLHKINDVEWQINNNIRLHFVGSRFFRVESNFNLTAKYDTVYLAGSVKCWAWLLPPLNNIAESYVLSQCKNEIINYTTDIIKKQQPAPPAQI